MERDINDALELLDSIRPIVAIMAFILSPLIGAWIWLKK